MIALDTNLLVHAHRRDAGFHPEAVELLRTCAESPRPWAICYHGLIEFYGVVTHRKIWSKPSTPAEAFNQIRAWQESPSLRLLHDDTASLDVLEEIVKKAKVNGPMIHDARIAACCLSSGVRELWTVDRDFSRFGDLKTRNPIAR